jgi:hypothetical protein
MSRGVQFGGLTLLLGLLAIATPAHASQPPAGGEARQLQFEARHPLADDPAQGRAAMEAVALRVQPEPRPVSIVPTQLEPLVELAQKVKIEIDGTPNLQKYSVGVQLLRY